MAFPSSIQLGQGGSLALVILQNGSTDLITITSIVGRYFETKYGMFQLNTHMRYAWGKKSLYFYYQGAPNPIDIESAVTVLRYLSDVNDPVLRIADLDNPTTQTALGYETLQFIEAFKQADEEGIEHAFDIPLRADKKPKPSGSLTGISNMPPNVGLYVTKDRKVQKIKLNIRRNENGKAIAKAGKDLTFDVSDKKTRYTHGKSSLFVLFEGYDKPVYLNVDSYLGAFIPYEPITVMDTEQDIRHTHRVVQLATKKVDKKPFNIMLIMIAIIGFVVIYQVVINPYLSHQQSQAELDKINQNQIAQKELDIKQQQLALEKQKLQTPQAGSTNGPIISEK